MTIEDCIQTILSAHVGEVNSITADDLREALFGVGFIVGMSELRGIIHTMKKNRYLVCSGQGGYFLPLSKKEALDSIERVHRVPARDHLHTARIQREVAKAQFEPIPVKQMEMEI